MTCGFCFFTKLKQSAKEEEEAGKRVEQMVSLLFQVHLCCLLLSERCKVLKPNRVAASVCFIRNISPRGVIFHYLIFLIVCFPWHIIWEESHPSIPFEAQSMQQFVFLLDFLCILSAGFGCCFLKIRHQFACVLHQRKHLSYRIIRFLKEKLWILKSCALSFCWQEDAMRGWWWRSGILLCFQENACGNYPKFF